MIKQRQCPCCGADCQLTEIVEWGISNLIVSPIQEHSKKPNIVRDKIIQLVGDLPRIEIFGRTKVHGWDVIGNDEKLQNQPLEVFS